MDIATTLVIEYQDNRKVCRTAKLSRPMNLHEVSDLLAREEGKKPSVLTIVDGVAFAEYYTDSPWQAVARMLQFA